MREIRAGPRRGLNQQPVLPRLPVQQPNERPNNPAANLRRLDPRRANLPVLAAADSNPVLPRRLPGLQQRAIGLRCGSGREYKICLVLVLHREDLPRRDSLPFNFAEHHQNPRENLQGPADPFLDHLDTLFPAASRATGKDSFLI